MFQQTLSMEPLFYHKVMILYILTTGKCSIYYATHMRVRKVDAMKVRFLIRLVSCHRQFGLRTSIGDPSIGDPKSATVIGKSENSRPGLNLFRISIISMIMKKEKKNTAVYSVKASAACSSSLM